mmetsp:Transcript_117357/g.366849  ORF Transcript_117357/g.366849 Transcript_117357/m.366849 type:complete len:228 (+) Transcript_117357:2-685(+)
MAASRTLALLPLLLASATSREPPLDAGLAADDECAAEGHCAWSALQHRAMKRAGARGEADVSAGAASMQVDNFVLYRQGAICRGPFVGTGAADPNCNSDKSQQTPACDQSGNEKCRTTCEANPECEFYSHLRSINYCFFSAQCDETYQDTQNCNDPERDEAIYKKVSPGEPVSPGVPVDQNMCRMPWTCGCPGGPNWQGWCTDEGSAMRPWCQSESRCTGQCQGLWC